MTVTSDTQRPQRGARGTVWTSRVLVAAATAMAVIGMWLADLPGSLWLDEAGTAFVTEGTFGETVGRAARFQGQSPAYYVIVWAVRQVAGDSEVVLRLPSLIFMLLAALLLMRLAARMFGPPAHLISAALFVSFGSIAFAATDARPYALAVLMAVASTWTLLRWMDEPSMTRGATYVILAGGLVYAHFLFALIVPVQLAYVAIRTPEGIAHGLRRASLAGASLLALTAPSLVQVYRLAERRDDLRFPTDLPAPRLLEFVIPFFVAGALWALRRNDSVPDRGGHHLLATGLALVPPVMLAVATLAGILPFEPRYYLAGSVGLALLLGGLASRLPERAWAGVTIALIVFSMAIFPDVSAARAQDWTATSRLVNERVDAPSTPVLVRSGLIEATRSDWLTSPLTRRYLLYPLIHYPTEGDLIALPYDRRASSTDALTTITDRVTGSPRIILVSSFDDPFRAWFDRKLGDVGYGSEFLADYGSIRVVEYAK